MSETNEATTTTTTINNEPELATCLLGPHHDITAFASTDASRPVINAVHYMTIEDIIESKTFRCDWTGFSGIAKCECYGAYSLLARRKLAERNQALIFGQAIHAALDVRQRAQIAGRETSLVEMEAALPPFFTEGGQLITLPEDEHRTLGRAREVLGEYVSEYGLRDSFEILESEQAMEREAGLIRWRHPRYGEQATILVWQGVIDGVWRNEHGSCVKDTKTMKRGDLATERLKYQLGGQLKLYCWLKGLRDAIVDIVIVRPPTKWPSKIPRNECLRTPLRYEQRVIEEMREHVIKLLGFWLEACSQAGAPPRRGMATGACIWPSQCGYLGCCSLGDEESRTAWLMSGRYEHNDWDPMRAREAGE